MFVDASVEISVKRVFIGVFVDADVWFGLQRTSVAANYASAT